jgi:hypothetical protein
VNLRSNQSNSMVFQALDGSVNRPVACQKLSDGRTQLVLDFAAAGSLFVVFNSGQPDLKMPASIQSQLSRLFEPKRCDKEVSVHTPMAIPLEWTRRVDGSCIKWGDQSLSLKGPWEVTLQSPLEDEKPYNFEMSRLHNLVESEDDRIKYHSGTAIYTLPFECEADWLRDADEVILDLGNVYNIADVIINGKQLAYGLWAPPFRVPTPGTTASWPMPNSSPRSARPGRPFIQRASRARPALSDRSDLSPAVIMSNRPTDPRHLLPIGGDSHSNALSVYV